jgi:signal transduction histidine kinase
MMRPAHTWTVFGLCLAIVLAAMGWISLAALKLDREARQSATREENVRLALWRMESTLAPLITQENARPYFAYAPFYPAERAYTRMFAEIERGEVLVPSPLLAQVPSQVFLHFQIGPDDELTSPQVPLGNMQDLAEAAYTTHGKIEAAAARLARLRPLLPSDRLLGILPEEAPPVFSVGAPATTPGDRGSRGLGQQSVRNDAEWRMRTRNQLIAQANWDSNLAVASPDVSQGQMKAVWIGPALILARQVSVNGRRYVQGCWLDWPAIKEDLLERVADLLPAATLEPVRSGQDEEHGRMLAALPVRLVPGAVLAAPAGYISPMRVSLLIVWGCALLSAIAVAALLRGAVSLSERRGSFVSAVTHELRTPLTTLRMYTEMLAEGIISDEEKTRRYLTTLRAEADRLGHLVENVLAYARLESRRARNRVETVTLRELLDTVKGRLAQRTEQAGMSLAVQAGDEDLSARIHADVAAVEQILFNLVDNACKYASSALDRLVLLQAGRRSGFVFLRVRDNGPGIDRQDVPRLFRPFSTSTRAAASGKPGVGLGLALSRRLARDMGGDLRLDESVAHGAAFVLTLPVEPSPPGEC